ncbi:MAG: aldehyde dehydrogenase family protein, partial [Pseudomonadota bacterium]
SEVGLKDATASAYAVPEAERKGAVALVLGAGNVSSIAPLDCFQKLFQEHQVVLLKMNPVNAHLADHLRAALRPLIERDALRIVEGNGAAGAYLTEHSSVDEVHITGAEATHDAIVWGQGEAAEKARKSGTPRNPRRITSELGAVCPTIVVPGPWSRADILFQAEHIATQKMQNSGFNCVACQVLVMPGEWDLKDRLLREVKRVIARQTRLAYYPGAEARLAAFAEAGEAEQIARGDAPAFPLAPHRPGLHAETEIFAPAMSVKEIGGEGAGYLEAAIAFANEGLRGTLGANIIIHPKTLEAMGKRRFDALLGELRYGAIGVNIWSGAAFAFPHMPWGAFPGHTLADVGSGIGKVHNAFMFDRAEKAVVWGPWAPFPRSLKEGQGTLMPKPPWFVTHKSADKAAEALTEFTAKPKLGRLARLIWHNLRG